MTYTSSSCSSGLLAASLPYCANISALATPSLLAPLTYSLFHQLLIQLTFSSSRALSFSMLFIIFPPNTLYDSYSPLPAYGYGDESSLPHSDTDTPWRSSHHVRPDSSMRPNPNQRLSPSSDKLHFYQILTLALHQNALQRSTNESSSSIANIVQHLKIADCYSRQTIILD